MRADNDDEQLLELHMHGSQRLPDWWPPGPREPERVAFTHPRRIALALALCAALWAVALMGLIARGIA